MSNKIIFNICIVLFCTHLGKTEDDDDRLDYDGSRSESSESNEVYNVNLKANPVRVRNAGNKSNSSIINVSPKCKQGINSYPYSVSIQKKSSHYASGALVHKKWILSVAGEFHNIRETIKLFRARLGSVNCKKGGVLVPIKGIEIHPSYVYEEPSYDLAMLRIGPHVDYSDCVNPISLSNMKGLIVSAKFLSTYWPRLIVNGKILAQSAKERIKQYNMRVSTQKMIPWGKCYNLMQTYNHTLDVSSLCLEPIMTHHSPCMPDVGAPIIAEDGLWGITSGWISDDCSTSPGPTIFTRTSLQPVKSWLDTLLDDRQ